MSALTFEHVEGPLTDSELRASPVPITGTVTATPTGTQDVNIVGTTVTQPVSGTVAVSNFPATQNVAVTSSVEIEIKNDAGNPVPVYTSTPAGTPTVSRVTVGAAVAVTLAAADNTRKRALVFNEAGVLFVKLGTGASSTDYTVRMTANSLMEFDFIQTDPITAIKASGTTDVQVTLVV